MAIRIRISEADAKHNLITVTMKTIQACLGDLNSCCLVKRTFPCHTLLPLLPALQQAVAVVLCKGVVKCIVLLNLLGGWTNLDCGITCSQHHALNQQQEIRHINNPTQPEAQHFVQGVFCGDCLFMSYGESILPLILNCA